MTNTTTVRQLPGTNFKRWVRWIFAFSLGFNIPIIILHWYEGDLRRYLRETLDLWPWALGVLAIIGLIMWLTGRDPLREPK